MRLRNLESHFPELQGVQEEDRELLVEEARYDVFVTRKGSGRWVLGSTGSLVAGFSLGLVVAMACDLFTGTSPIWVNVLFGALTAPIFLWYQQRRYVALLRPTVAKLCHARAA